MPAPPLAGRNSVYSSVFCPVDKVVSCGGKGSGEMSGLFLRISARYWLGISRKAGLVENGSEWGQVEGFRA
jgi:hypothetical protein